MPRQAADKQLNVSAILDDIPLMDERSRHVTGTKGSWRQKVLCMHPVGRYPNLLPGKEADKGRCWQ
ncbi:MAG: hypothetical protein M0C28_31225 [Candidatus Moduliflexus flocculans]|nr:hypothetical protein [Candidatus Moduliflexus flocculans]